MSNHWLKTKSKIKQKTLTDLPPDCFSEISKFLSFSTGLISFRYSCQQVYQTSLIHSRFYQSFSKDIKSTAKFFCMSGSKYLKKYSVKKHINIMNEIIIKINDLLEKNEKVNIGELVFLIELLFFYMELREYREGMKKIIFNYFALLFKFVNVKELYVIWDRKKYFWKANDKLYQIYPPRSLLIEYIDYWYRNGLLNKKIVTLCKNGFDVFHNLIVIPYRDLINVEKYSWLEKTSSFFNIFHILVWLGDHETLKFFLSFKKVDVFRMANTGDNLKRTPLHYSVINDDVNRKKCFDILYNCQFIRKDLKDDDQNTYEGLKRLIDNSQNIPLMDKDDEPIEKDLLYDILRVNGFDKYIPKFLENHVKFSDLYYDDKVCVHLNFEDFANIFDNIFLSDTEEKDRFYSVILKKFGLVNYDYKKKDDFNYNNNYGNDEEGVIEFEKILLEFAENGSLTTEMFSFTGADEKIEKDIENKLESCESCEKLDDEKEVYSGCDAFFVENNYRNYRNYRKENGVLIKNNKIKEKKYDKNCHSKVFNFGISNFNVLYREIAQDYKSDLLFTIHSILLSQNSSENFLMKIFKLAKHFQKFYREKELTYRHFVKAVNLVNKSDQVKEIDFVLTNSMTNEMVRQLEELESKEKVPLLNNYYNDEGGIGDYSLDEKVLIEWSESEEESDSSDSSDSTNSSDSSDDSDYRGFGTQNKPIQL